MSAVVTGVGGFVARALLPYLEQHRGLSLSHEDWRTRVAETDFRGATVFHLAARVHHAGPQAEQAFNHDNVEKTEALARAAASQDARAFVFVSTAKVNGEESAATPFRASDMPHPEDAYARSKWAAERALARVAADTGLPVTIVRPPLVYGRGARANLRALVRLCDSPLPLPFAGVDNRRSFIEVTDLARLLATCAHERRGATLTFMAAHPRAVSTRELVGALRAGLSRKARLFSLPVPWLEAFAKIAGQGDNMRRLTRSLVVEASETQRSLGWQAQVGFEEAIARTIAGYRNGRGR